jgi:hypothetical protein
LKFRLEKPISVKHVGIVQKRKMPRDANQLAARIVAMSTGQVPEEPATGPDPSKNQSAVALGRLGGLKGGKARAEKLSKRKRSEIARIAAAARWKKSD